MDAKYLTVRRGSMSVAGFGGAHVQPGLASEKDDPGSGRVNQALLMFDEPVGAAAIAASLKVMGLENPGHFSMMLGGAMIPGGWIEICLFDSDEGAPLRVGSGLGELLGATAFHPWRGSLSLLELRAELERLELGSCVSTAPGQGSWGL